jgi:toxin ParE1/3/4
VAHVVAPRAEADLDDIWLHVAKENGSMEVADRSIDSITDRFLFLSSFPHAGRTRDLEFGSGVRSFPVGEFVIVYCVHGQDIFILRVVHGRRDFDMLI